MILYLLSPRALARLGQQQFDGRGALRHGAVVVAVLLRVVLRGAADGLLAGRRGGAGRRLPLEQRLLLAALVPAESQQCGSIKNPRS